MCERERERRKEVEREGGREGEKEEGKGGREGRGGRERKGEGGGGEKERYRYRQTFCIIIKGNLPPPPPLQKTTECVLFLDSTLPAVYSWYSLSEYLVVLTNVAFHTVELVDFAANCYITIAIPTTTTSAAKYN